MSVGQDMPTIEKEWLQAASNPIFFERNRVFRVYQGGKLFNGFFGDEAADGNYPEEWIASGVRALNSNSRSGKEGVSKILGKDIYFDELLEAHKDLMIGGRASFDILVKMLDSAVRLPVQAHPDKAFSKEHFKSEYGKTEMWIILATRDDAKIYYGFKDGLKREDFISAIEKSAQDKGIMASFLNELPARKGDVYLIPAKIAHAIGYGCLILEVQEPTDFTVQPEMWCGDYRLNEYEMYLGLNKETALDCFDFSITGETALGLGRRKPAVIEETEFSCSESLIGYEDTKCFSVNRHDIKGESFVLKNAPSVVIVTEGRGVLKKGNDLYPVKKGDYFFLPFSVEGLCSLGTDSRLEIIECLPSLSK